MLAGIARKIPNQVIADHVCGGIDKRRGGFNNSQDKFLEMYVGVVGLWWMIVCVCVEGGGASERKDVKL
jgi:hypothetical protein